MYLLNHIIANSLTTGLMIASGTNSQSYRPSDSKKNVCIQSYAHDAFLEWPLSGTLKFERSERQKQCWGQ